jgi:putative membrane protein
VLGCALGIAAFSRVLGWLLHKYEHTVVAFLVGLLIGTLWRIWPYQHLTKIVVREKERVIGAKPFWPVSWDVSVALLMVAGFAAVLLIEYVATRRAKAVSPA